MKKSTIPFNLYEVVTSKILAQIEATGKLTWVKPWNNKNGDIPMNGKTKRPYDGVNFFLLQMSGFSSNYWLTYNQITEMKGTIKKGEHATQVVFWKMNLYKDVDKKTGEETVKKVPFLKYYNVFNVDQCEGITIENSAPVVIYNELEKLEACEVIIAGYKAANPSITMQIHECSQAYYTSNIDLINMPLLIQFCGQAEYYSTFFHEMAHSTGHKDRLNRKEVTTVNKFDSCDYGYEELTAELTAAFICAEIGISNESQERNSLTYLKNWMNAIKADKKLFIMAAQRASKAAKFITGKTEVETDSNQQIAA